MTALSASLHCNDTVLLRVGATRHFGRIVNILQNMILILGRSATCHDHWRNVAITVASLEITVASTALVDVAESTELTAAVYSI